jgi:hypothetical protein
MSPARFLTFPRSQIGDRLAAFRQPQGVDRPRVHHEIGVTHTQFRLKAGEEMILAACPGHGGFHPRRWLPGCVFRLDLDQWVGQDLVTDQLAAIEHKRRAGCKGWDACGTRSNCRIWSA